MIAARAAAVAVDVPLREYPYTRRFSTLVAIPARDVAAVVAAQHDTTKR